MTVPSAPTSIPQRTQAAVDENAPASIVSVRFDGISRPVEFRNCPEVIDILRRIFRGWHFASGQSSEPAELTITRDGSRYSIAAPWLDGQIQDRSSVSAACSLIIDIVCAFIKDNPSLLCLHCGAVMLAGKAVVFPSTNHAGKSTLVSRLAAEGLRIIADDVMPITAADGQCLALGIAPRPRVPLPASASRAFRKFVRTHAGPGDRSYQYLQLPQGGLAAHGERAPFGAIVMLERQEGVRAAFRTANRSEALRALIVQNFARGEPAADILRRLHRVVEHVPAVRLCYSDLDEATALIVETFRRWPPTLPAHASEAPPAGAAEQQVRQIRRRDTAQPPAPRKRAPSKKALFVRHPEATGETLEGEVFLSDPTGQSILHLNFLGAAIWNLLLEPTSVETATEAISLAFPDRPEPEVRSDVEVLFRDLRKAGLVQAAHSSGATSSTS